MAVAAAAAAAVAAAARPFQDACHGLLQRGRPAAAEAGEARSEQGGEREGMVVTRASAPAFQTGFRNGGFSGSNDVSMIEYERMGKVAKPRANPSLRPLSSIIRLVDYNLGHNFSWRMSQDKMKDVFL